MNRKLIILTLAALASFGAHAGVKVTSVDLTTDKSDGHIKIALEGRSSELPDYKVNGKTIEITLSDAKAFSAISKNVRGAHLTANVLNGKAIIKATLPYEVASDQVSLNWRNQNIEVTFPRGRVARVESDRPATPVKPVTTPAPTKTENVVLKKVESKIDKKNLNEDYLNNLVKEDTSKKSDPMVKDDSVTVKQAAIVKTEKSQNVTANNNFSFAGYSAKFAVFLALVLGLFYGAVQLLKRGIFNRGKLGFLNNSQMIQVLSTTFVAPKRSIMVVKAHNQIFLVANSENGITFLSEMTDTTGLIKEGEKLVTGTNFDLNLGTAEITTSDSAFKIKENIHESAPESKQTGIAGLSAKDIVKFSDELKKKAKKLKPIEFN